MKGDFTRSTFRPHRHYSGVRMQQGRVALDADWNEQADIAAHLDETVHGDVIGGCGVPKDEPGFALRAAPDGTDLVIAPGRAYVDGILCQLEATPVAVTELQAGSARLEALVSDGLELRAHDWVEVLDRAAGPGAGRLRRLVAVDRDTLTVAFAPDLDDADLAQLTAEDADPAVRRLAAYTTQPHLPAPDHTADGADGAPTLQAGDGTYLAYLEVWRRHVTALDDPAIRERALGGPDTTTRVQTVWQVRLAALDDPGIETCADLPDWPAPLAAAGRPPSSGRLRARAQPEAPPEGPCVLPPGAGYRRLENQLYRVEVHQPGELDEATFKWSRDNASVVAGWTGQSGNALTVSTLGRDGVLGFASGQLVELVDDGRELHGLPGVLARISEPPRDHTVVVDAAVDRDDFPHNPKVRRWDSPAEQTVEAPAADGGWLRLESGVEVCFEPGHYNTGDHWLVPARTVDGDVEWPRDSRGRPLARPPDGIAHHYCPLALVRVGDGVPTVLDDCRETFPTLTGMTAADVGFDNTACELAGATTVQGALDALCEEHTLRRHNKHLHGWGIVCGLQVVCGPNTPAEPRRHVTVREGYAIDCDGNDMVVDADEPVDVLALVEGLQERDPDRPVLDDGGDGEVCLVLEPQPDRLGHRIVAERYDPSRDTPAGLLAGTLLMDFYVSCVKPVEDFLRDELTADDDSGAGPGYQREAVLANLLAQIVNPRAGQRTYLSAREHELLRGFYDRLRALLRSATFCAMFDGARPFPDYPPEMPEGMDTIFGRGHHSRLRLRPAGGASREAYTVGGGINPLRPTTLINRYDLERRELVARIDPVAGAADPDEVDSGSGAVQDVAFSPDGRRIYMVAPTRNGTNTFFRAGRITDEGVDWGPLVTICDVRLVTLGTTAADRNHVYAVGLGRGLYRIDPDEVDPSMEPLVAFPAAGHLRIAADGRAIVTAAAATQAPRYDRLRGLRLPDGTQLFQAALSGPGVDDIALHEPDEGPTERSPQPVAYVVVGLDGAGEKRIEAYNFEGQRQQGAVPTDDTTVRLDVFAPPGEPALLLVTSEDGYLLRLVDTTRFQAVDGYELPLQAGPTAIAADSAGGTAYALNYVTNTLTVLPDDVLQPSFRFPFAELAAYRSGVLEALIDLTGGFLQYLKDCLCHHFLVDCPECTGEETLYLACVSIRGSQVYNACNFSGRKYVKSFPTVGYWLSLVPVLPLAKRLVEWLCCMVLPEAFGRLRIPVQAVPEPAPARPHEANVRVSTAREGVGTVQAADVPSRVRRGRRDLGVLSGAAGASLVEGLAAPRRGPGLGDMLDRPGDAVETLLTRMGVGVQHADYDPAGGPGLLDLVMTLLRPPRPGDQITLHERDDRVRAVSVTTPPGPPDARVEGLARSLEEREAEIARLREQVEELRAFRRQVTDFMRSRGGDPGDGA